MPRKPSATYTTSTDAKPEKTKALAPNGGGSVIKELWQAAVNLRGSIEPGDYKRYVLPIIFLRFLSLRYEKRRHELANLIQDEKSDYFGYNAALEDPDEYRSAGAFVLPEDARWENIRKIARADDIKIRLDNILELLEKTYPERLRGLLPGIYADSNLDRESVASLINLFSGDVFSRSHDGEDLIGHVYEYFIGEFASSEGKRGGEYFTPSSIVRMLVAMLEPKEGIVFDPCCGSGGMFVQSDLFTHHSHRLSFVGQESKDFTYRLCRMNLFIHGVDGDIQLGNSYFDDKHASLRADYILANPPFNDGAKSDEGWGAARILDKDPRLKIDTETIPLSPRSANTMWMLHFLHHLKDGGTAGFVMATGEVSNSETARTAARKALVDHDYVDCIVQLTGQLFANTQIPCCLWFLSKNRGGSHGSRRREGEILFIDGRRLGALIPGSRKQKQLSGEEITRVAEVYHQFRYQSDPPEVPGFCAIGRVEDVRSQGYVLTPGRYIATDNVEDEGESFEALLPSLFQTLRQQLDRSDELGREVRAVLGELNT